MSECTCLTEYAPELPHSAHECDLGTEGGDRTPLRDLAELAAYRDLDAALLILRGLR